MALRVGENVTANATPGEKIKYAPTDLVNRIQYQILGISNELRDNPANILPRQVR